VEDQNSDTNAVAENIFQECAGNTRCQNLFRMPVSATQRGAEHFALEQCILCAKVGAPFLTGERSTYVASQWAKGIE
jgi:hypothetical protein